MKKSALTVALLILLAGAAHAVTDMPFPNLNRMDLVQPGQGEFTFVVLGDFRPARRDIPYPEAFTRMLDEVKTIHPSLVLSVGDAYYGYGGSFQRFQNEIARFLSLARTAGVPFYNAIGNHEVTDDPRERNLRQTGVRKALRFIRRRPVPLHRPRHRGEGPGRDDFRPAARLAQKRPRSEQRRRQHLRIFAQASLFSREA